MNLLLENNKINTKDVVARFMDVGLTEGDDLSKLVSHLVRGVLSRRELALLDIPLNPYVRQNGEPTFYTPDDEISVFNGDEFRYETHSSCRGAREMAIFLPRGITSDSSIQNEQVDHPVVHDSVPLNQREILGFYLGNRDEELSSKVFSLSHDILGRTLPIIYPTSRFGVYELK